MSQVLPQTYENFEVLPLCLDVPASSGVPAISATAAITGDSGGLLGTDLLTRAGRYQWAASRLPLARDMWSWMVGVWVRPRLLPTWVTPVNDQPLLSVVTDQGGPSFCILHDDPGDGTRFAFRIGTIGTRIEIPIDEAAFVEIRARFDDPATQWTYEGRVNGELKFTRDEDGHDAPENIALVQLDVLTFTSALGIEIDVDGMWWWSGGEFDEQPDWWSDRNGWDGHPTPTILTARVGPTPVAATLSEAVVHILPAVDQQLAVTITATADLDTQPVKVALVARGTATPTWDDAAWIGEVGPSRVAVVDVGPSHTIDPAAGIYEAWVQVDAGTPVLADGDVVVV